MSEFRTRRRGSPRQRGLRFPVDKASEAGQRQVQARERYLATLLKEGKPLEEKSVTVKAWRCTCGNPSGKKYFSLGRHLVDFPYTGREDVWCADCDGFLCHAYEMGIGEPGEGEPGEQEYMLDPGQ